MDIKRSNVPDNTSGTADFDDFEDKDPDDCYCESTSESGHLFQEASHKTKLNREKNKIKDDLNYNKSSGVGELHDSSSGISVPVDLTFDNKRQTSTGYLTYKNGRRAVGMNINPNDLNRGHGFTKYLHEKNHILQDLRKRNDGNDNNDLSMISAFISKHSNEIKTSHSSDKDEYLADLNVARTRGYDKTIRMLQDMMIKPLKSSPSAKHSKSFINKSANNKIDNELSGEFLNELYKKYNEMLDDEKLLLTTMKASRNVGEHHYKSLEKRIKKMESDTSSKEHFMKVARQASFIQEVNKGIDEHNSDLKLRILFLRDMKKIDSTNNDIKYKKKKSFTESGEPILSLFNTINNRAYDNTSKLQSKIDEFIIEHFGIIDNNDSVNGMILSYVILDYVEEIINNEGDVIMESTYTPLSEFDHFFLEGYSKKQERRVEKFLKENRFEEDPSKTTDEEKRKGYRRGTIETDIPDENGKKQRVPFEMSPHDDTPAEVRIKGDDKYEIHMSKKTVSRKPAISNFIFKHEEGHVAIRLDKSGKYVMEMEEIDKILTRLLHKMFTNKNDTLNSHDKNIEEFLADKYAKEHSKYDKTSKYSLRDEGVDISTKKALVGLQSLLSNDVYLKKTFQHQYNSYVLPEAMNMMNEKHREDVKKYNDYRSMLQSSLDHINDTNKLLVGFKNLVRSAEFRLKQNESDLKRYKADIERDHRAAYDLMKMYSDDLNNELIIARENGHVLSKAERRKKVDKMFYKIYMSTLGSRPEVSRYIKYTIGSSDEKDYPEKLKKDLDSYRENVIFNKSHLQSLMKNVKEIEEEVTAAIKRSEELKNEIKRMSDELDEYYEKTKTSKSTYKTEEFQKCLERVKMKNYSLMSKSRLFNDDMSTTVRILMCLPKEERDRFAKEVHDVTLKYAKAERGESTVNESYTPLSEFDHFFQEAKMKAKTRKELDDSDFALVYKDASGEKIRKYPINDEAHVKAAARMFPRGVPNKYRKEVAGKILRRAHKFDIDTSGWKSLNAANEKD